jgi:hypothetical protein
VGNGIRRMAETHQYGVFYNPKGTQVHLLYLFGNNLNDLCADQVAVMPKSKAEAA